MILPFKNQFKQPILEGVKIHTLRVDPNNRWIPEKIIHMATGVRTPQYNCFKEDTCKGIEYAFMSYYPANGHGLEISLGRTHYCDNYIYYDTKEILAKNDGFENVESFEDWFIRDLMYKEHNSQLYKIIHWTDFRYIKKDDKNGI